MDSESKLSEFMQIAFEYFKLRLQCFLIINQKAMSKYLLTRTHEMRDDEFDIAQSHKDLPQGHFDNHLIEVVKEDKFITNANCDKQVVACQSRSIKNRPGNFQISFQEDFMEEHLNAFKKNTQNLIEQSLNIENIEGSNFSNAELFGTKMNKGELKIQRLNLLLPQLGTQFKKDLETQQKLREFLKLLQNEVPEQVLHELTFLAYFAWEKYIEIRKSTMSERELLKVAQDLAKDLTDRQFDGGSIKFLNFEKVNRQMLKSEDKILQNFQNYLEFFLSTIFLVIEGYFENPYSEGNKIKRQRSFDAFEWEEELFGSPVSENSFGMPIKRFKLQ